MASNEYLKLCEEAQRKKLKITKKQEKEIKSIYKNIYLNISKKLSKVDKNNLSKRYLESLIEVIKEEIKLSQNKISKTIKDNCKEVSSEANNVQLDFFMLIDEKYELGLASTFKDMFAKIPKDAMNEIIFGKAYKDRKGLSERIWQYTKKFDKDIDYILAQGIAEKKSYYDIAKDLEKYVNPDAKKDWDWCKVYPNSSKRVDYNAQRLARTAVNHAFQQAQKRSCEKNPYVEGIRWISANSHGRTCELCMERDNQIFKINEVPLDYPNGLCTTVPEIPMSLEEIGTELRAWVDGEKNIKLDKWFKDYGEDFL